MRLKKIEVVGFKSFADREVIQVDERVTGVIGPNGCGKSNIVDAVRWAMGEQSAKHLRGSGMSDVIFAGCATRGPAGMAEVTLTFENEGDLPAAYLDYPEIGITRRLLADGTSEYLINKVPSRLRDINEILLGTGAGSKGYSIIEQGQVGKLTTSKPEERRHVIDEAAGITRFKAQKAAAERKILATRQNLMRVQDVIAELEARLGTLKRQAQKAERYKRYRTELRDLDLWTASHKFLELQATGTVLEDRRKDLARQVDDLKRELGTRETLIQAKRLDVGEVERELSARQEKVYGLDNRIKLIENENEFRDRERKGLETSVAQARAEVEVVGRSLALLEQELSEVKDQRVALGDGSGAGERSAVDSATEEHATVVARLSETTAEVERLRVDMATVREKLAGAEARRQSWRESAEQLAGRVETTASELAELEAAVAEKKAGRTREEAVLTGAAAGVDRARERRASLDLRRASLRQDVQKAEVELDTSRAELQRARSRLQSLEEIQNRYRRCASGVQVVMEHQAELGASVSTDGSVDRPAASAKPVLGIMADYISAPQHLEAAVSAVLGDRLEGVVVDGPEAGVRGVELLKRVQEGRTTFLPRAVRTHEPPAAAGKTGWSDPSRRGGGGGIEVVDLSNRATGATGTDPSALPAGVLGRLSDLVQVDGELADMAGVLLGDTTVVNDLPRALELWQAGEIGGTIVTTDGDRIEPSGVVVGGSSNALDSALLQQKREISELQDIQRELEENLEGARRRHLGLAEELAAVETQREQSEEELLQAEQARLTASKEVEQATSALAELDTRVVATRGTLEELRARQAERNRELDDLEREQAAEQARLPALERAARDLETRAASLVEDRERIAAALTDAKVALARWQQQSDALEASFERVSRQLASERERSRRLNQSAADGEARMEELAAQKAAATAEREQLVLESREATDAVHDARERHDALRLELDELELSVRNLRNELDEERERLKDVEMGLQQNDLERNHLLGDIADRFDTSLYEVLIDFHHRPLAGKTEKDRQRDLKRILSRMGEVNLTAIDEYDEVSQRYEYLTGQKDDLESAIGQLQEAIDRINKTTRQRFRDTFDQVNERFQQVFPRLFNGGRAELIMTDPSDLLGTGVEIHAQPPGKQLRSLELLSGGEKALTATSLIFAIFLIKPSPFCILDEVDAPLDDANVGRFCHLVGELSQQTQFIIITHNKITMETADRLYGVTMEQRGVSKLVSVNLRKAVELAYN